MSGGIAIKLAVSGLLVSASVAPDPEVWVRQARISGGTPVAEENKPVKNAPEGNSANVAQGSPTTRTTCNQANASSPACYSATQQARGK